MGTYGRFYADIMSVHPEVTGSCNLVVVKLPNGETIKFIVDCGLFQEREYDQLNDSLPFDAEDVDFAIVTHNHVDHIGRLPFLVKNGFRGEIYTTESTSKLMPLALNDSYRILKGVFKRKNQRELYGETDVSDTMTLVKACNYFETLKANDNIKITFLENGHLIGAALVLVQISYPEHEDINILFTGDYNNKNMFFDITPVPKWVLELPLTVVQESTYGYVDSDIVVKTFEDNVLKCVNNGGTVIVPVFSLGRAQECLYILKCMQDNEELDKNIPIYLDGKLAIKYTSLYLMRELNIKEEMEDFLPENLTFVDKVSRPALLEDTEVKIILTTSGMGSYGPAQIYIPTYIARKNCLIQFTGYTSEGTLGARLKNTELGETVEVGGLLVKKRADVEYTTEFSAHAKADEMIEFLNQFENLKLVLVNHGHAEVKMSFAERILDEVSPKMVGILGREYFFRVNPYGLQKTLPTKFK